MTTPEAAARYLQDHLASCRDRSWAVYNPKMRPVEDLPVIYGFNNGGSPGWFSAVSIAQDGTALGGHLCSDEGYMEHDLGILEGSRPDRHTDQYQKHYPDGYRMEFVSTPDIATHAALNEAFRLNKSQGKDKP